MAKRGNMLRRILARFRPPPPAAPELPPIKPPDFAQLSEPSPVGRYIGIAGGAAALLAAGTYLIQTAPRPARPPETIVPISETKPADRETTGPVPETKPVIRETPWPIAGHARSTGTAQLKGYCRNGKWIALAEFVQRDKSCLRAEVTYSKTSVASSRSRESTE